MQKLHLVGLTTDLGGLIFSTRKGARSGSYVVPVDARLLAVIADTLQRRNGAAAEELPAELVAVVAPAAGEREEARPPRQESALSPREIQARLRAGRTLDEVAHEAGVDTSWVERFAAPILAEQAQVVGHAVSRTYTKPRTGTSSVPLAEAVRRNLADRGVRLAPDELEQAWSAYQLDDDRWVVRLRYRSRGRAQEAEWELDPRAGELTARNRLAGQLGYWGARRRRAAPPAPAPAGATGAAKKAAPATRRAAAARTATAKAAAKKPARAKRPAEKSAAAKPPRTPAAGKARPATRSAAARTATAKPPRTAGAAQGRPAKKPVAPAKPSRVAAGGTAAAGVAAQPPAATNAAPASAGTTAGTQEHGAAVPPRRARPLRARPLRST